MLHGREPPQGQTAGARGGQHSHERRERAASKEHGSKELSNKQERDNRQQTKDNTQQKTDRTQSFIVSQVQHAAWSKLEQVYGNRYLDRFVGQETKGLLFSLPIRPSAYLSLHGLYHDTTYALRAGVCARIKRDPRVLRLLTPPLGKPSAIVRVTEGTVRPSPSRSVYCSHCQCCLSLLR